MPQVSSPNFLRMETFHKLTDHCFNPVALMRQVERIAGRFPLFTFVRCQQSQALVSLGAQ